MVRNPLRRAAEVPASVLSAAPLAKGEKVLTGVATRSGSWLLGTRDALLVVSGPASVESVEPVESRGVGPVEPVEPVGPVGPVGPVETRIPWQQVERADWERDLDRLRVIEVGEFGRPRPEHSFEIDAPGRLPELVRERVTASVVLQRHVTVSGKKGVFVIARRPPRGSGEIAWSYQFDPGIDPDDPAVMAAARRGLATASEELGL